MAEAMGMVEDELKGLLSALSFRENGLKEGQQEKVLKDCIQKIRERRLKKDKRELLLKIREAERGKEGRDLEVLLRERQDLSKREEGHRKSNL